MEAVDWAVRLKTMVILLQEHVTDIYKVFQWVPDELISLGADLERLTAVNDLLVCVGLLEVSQ